MKVLPFVHEGLGNSSYLVEVGDGDALLVDPDRSFDRYLRAAEERGWSIAGVLETHVHADFVTGAVEALDAVDAPVFVPADSGCRYPHQAARPREPIRVAGAQIEPIASPGHTPEHLSYVLRSGSRPPVLFSGGSIIVGGAARTDLISPERTEELTRKQYRTLREAFSALPDETLLYPTHGGGSFCSAGAGGERSSTLGEQRSDNPALAAIDEDEFVRWFPATFPAAPDYFFRMRAFNQAGPRLRAEIATAKPLSPDDFERLSRQGLIIDVRTMEEYARAHIPGSLSIPFRDVYPVWLGWLVSPETDLLFVLGDVPLEDVTDESLLVGYERFAGWLQGNVPAWQAAGKPMQDHSLVDASQAQRLLADGAVALDVREPTEVRAGRVDDAIAIPLGELAARIEEVPKDRPVIVYCGHGERSSTGVSLLERAGLSDLMNLDGGYDAWQRAADR
ncbi:MAG: rhodanese-like domain-containing protein [Dehalococcoidia bacterium]